MNLNYDGLENENFLRLKFLPFISWSSGDKSESDDSFFSRFGVKFPSNFGSITGDTFSLFFVSDDEDEDFFSDGVEDEDDDVITFEDELTLGDSFFGLIRDFGSIEWACFGLINIESWDGDFLWILEEKFTRDNPR